MAGYPRGLASVTHPTLERLELHTQDPVMGEHITHVASDKHQDSITAAWLLPRATSPELRTIPHEPKPFRRLAKKLLAHGPARACYEAGPPGYVPQRHLEARGLPCEIIGQSQTSRPLALGRKPDQRPKRKRSNHFCAAHQSHHTREGSTVENFRLTGLKR